MGSWFYPRTVKITRQAKPAAVGSLAYQGAQMASETVIVATTPASIQQNTPSSKPLGGLPADAIGRGAWRIFLPQIKLGTVQQNDIVTDDLGDRYQITLPYWNGFNYLCIAETLKT